MARRGVVAPILRRLEDGSYGLVYSQGQLNELADVLARDQFRLRYGVTPSRRDDLIALIVERGERVFPTRTISACRDPDDNRLLEAAVAGQVDVLVTTDRDLLALDPFEGIRIVTPATFFAMLDRE